MTGHQERVVLEYRQTIERFNKLQAFIGTKTYLTIDSAEQWRLRKQAMIMELLLEVLRDRIAAFEDKPKANA